MAFSVTLNAEDSNATSKVDTNVREKVADDINDGWWDDSDLDISDILAVQAELKSTEAELKSTEAELKSTEAESKSTQEEKRKLWKIIFAND